MKRVVIKHLSGPKAHQESDFDIEQLTSISFGRDPASTIAFDGPGSDAVSRHHARLDRTPGDPPGFVLSEVEARNGVLVNGARLSGSAPLRHGDVVQLGLEGPTFKFCVDPEPAAALAPTREVVPAAVLAPTREVVAAAALAPTREVVAAAALAPTREVEAAATVPRRIVIRVLTGAHANQETAFPLASLREITLGRDRAASVVFDAERDDAVSRLHARIQRGDREGEFLLTDVDSRNGVFLNGAKVQSAPIHHDDEVQLGLEGPRLSFRLDPPPVALATGLVQSARAPLLPTREVSPSAAEAIARGVPQGGPAGSASPSLHPPPATWTSQSGTGHAAAAAGSRANGLRKAVVAASVGAIAVAALAVGVAVSRKPASDHAAPSVTASPATPPPEAPLASTMTDAEINAKYGRATVFIMMGWKLIYQGSGQQVYHAHRVGDGQPMYEESDSGGIKPILIDREEAVVERRTGRVKVHGEAIGDMSRGSGFAVGTSGFILTNAHVAVPWTLPYHGLRDGVLWMGNGRFVGVRAPQDWVPGKLWRGLHGEPLPMLEGRTDTLQVTFASMKEPIQAKLVKFSYAQDVALIKVDVPGAVSWTELAPEVDDAKIVVGQHVVGLGYPGTSADAVIRVQGKDQLGRGGDVVLVPMPTLTSGAIAKLPSHLESPLGGPKDAYQLTFMVQHGNSGGPLFNDRGQVIGIIYAGDEAASYAVPIKYGRDLMIMQSAK